MISPAYMMITRSEMRATVARSWEM